MSYIHNIRCVAYFLKKGYYITPINDVLGQKWSIYSVSGVQCISVTLVSFIVEKHNRKKTFNMDFWENAAALQNKHYPKE